MAEAEPLLEIDTLVDRPKIVIDGYLYDILSPDELSVVDHQRFAAQGRRMEELMTRRSLTKAQERELTDIVDGLSQRVMVGVPEEVRAKLTSAHRLNVLEVFTTLPLQKRLKAMAAGAPNGSTGGRLRPGSSVSTAETPPAGSPRSPSSSSVRT